jgi:hypothetical protein
MMPLLKSKKWRMTHLYKIRNKQGQLVTFKPNHIQLKHLQERRNHHRNLILKYRQGGITTLYVIDELDEALWVPGTNCAILAHEQGTLDKIFEIVKRAYDNLPDEIKPGTKTNTVREFKFTKRFDGVDLDSSIYVDLDLRGGTVQRLHITESAYIKDRQKLAAGSKQAVPKDGWISEETTGNGYEDFYDLYEDSRANPNPGPYDYKTYFYAWFEDPDYTLPGDELVIFPEDIQEYGDELALQEKFNLTDGQLRWRRWKIRELKTKRGTDGIALSGLQLFKQEYPSTINEAFQSGMGNVFDGEKLEQLVTRPGFSRIELYRFIENLYPQHEWQQRKADVDALLAFHINIWELPIPGHEYVLGCDPSDGLGADYGPIDIWDKNTLHQVAQFYGKARPDELAEIAALMGKFYNKAYAGIENNMLACILFFIKIYDFYFYTVKVDQKTLKRSKTVGWNTNTKTRNLMIDDFLIDFEEMADNGMVINSPVTVKEMRTFIKKENGKREHADGKFDDTLFAAFIARQMIRFYPKVGRVLEQKPEGF